jgi:SAM-dependent methyltransferase
VGTTERKGDHFSGVAAAYAASRPDYPPDLAAHLAATSPGRGLAWEAGCGSGQFTRVLAAHFAAVRATDLSTEQIAAAPALPGVSWAAAPADRSGLPAGSADLVTAAQAAHWFDLPAFYAEARRVARPGAVIALISYGVMEAEGAAGEALRRFHDMTLAPHWPPERRHVVSAYRDLPFPFASLPAPDFAILRDWSLADLSAYLDTWSAMRSLERAGDRVTRAAFDAELAALWGDPARRRRISWPIALRLGRLSAAT